MEIKVETSTEHIDDIVQIHMDTFEGFFLTFLGRDFLKLLYEGFIRHDKSELLVAIDNDKILGFLAYSQDMSDFYKYLLKTKLFHFGWCALKAFIKKPSIMMRLLSAFGKSEEVKREEKYIELSSIGVSPKYKGKGIGSKLIVELKKKVDFNEFKYISLETDAVDNEYANKFYQKNEFILDRTYETRQGRKMNEYHYGEEKL